MPKPKPDIVQRFKNLIRDIYPQNLIGRIEQDKYDPFIIGYDHDGFYDLPIIKKIFMRIRQEFPEKTIKVAFEIDPAQLQHIKDFLNDEKEYHQVGTINGVKPEVALVQALKAYRPKLEQHHGNTLALWLLDNGFNVVSIEHKDVLEWIKQDEKETAFGEFGEEGFGFGGVSVWWRPALTAIQRDIYGLEVIEREHPDIISVGTAHGLKYDLLLERVGRKSFYFSQQPLNWGKFILLWERAHDYYFQKSAGGIIVSLRYLTWGIVWNLGKLVRQVLNSKLVPAKWKSAVFSTWLRNHFPPESYDKSRASYNRIYDRWVGFFPETLLVVLAIAILNHHGINLKLSNVIAWSGFFLYHILEYSILKYVTSKSAPGFLKSMKFSRSPPINIFFAGLISVFSISLGFLPVSHSFLIWIVYLVPFQIHFNVNLAASSIFDNTLKSIRLPAKRTKTQVPDIAISNLGIPIEKHYRIQKNSLSRSLRQRFNGWSYNEVFETPLTLTDHLLLAIIAASVMSPSLLLAVAPIHSESVSLLLIGFLFTPFSFIVAISLMAPHIKEQSDAFLVFRNYLKYRKNPENSKVDAELLKLVNKFEAGINMGQDENNKWKISFTDNPYLLAQTDIDAKKIILNIGWIIYSSRQKDRRRLAYLTAVLRNIRKAIELRCYTDESVLQLGTVYHKPIGSEKGDYYVPNGKPLSYEVTYSHGEVLYKGSFTEIWLRYSFEISVRRDYPQSTTYSAYITNYEMKRDMMIEEMRIFEERLLDDIKSSDDETLKFIYGAVHAFIGKKLQASDSRSSDLKISSFPMLFGFAPPALFTGITDYIVWGTVLVSLAGVAWFIIKFREPIFRNFPTLFAESKTRQQAKKDARLMAAMLNTPHPHLLPQGKREPREKTPLAEMLNAVMPRQEKLNIGELDSRPLRFINNLSDNLRRDDYRQEFLEVLSKELETIGLKELPEAQVLESILNFAGYENTLPAKEVVLNQIKESRELNKIPVIKAVVRRADLSALKKIVEAQNETNEVNSENPARLLIVPAEENMEDDLRAIAVIASEQYVTIMKKADVLKNNIVDIELLDNLFREWAVTNGISIKDVYLTLAIPSGSRVNPAVIANLQPDSPVRNAFLIILDNLNAVPMKLTDFQKISEIAATIAKQA